MPQPAPQQALPHRFQLEQSPAVEVSLAVLIGAAAAACFGGKIRIRRPGLPLPAIIGNIAMTLSFHPSTGSPKAPFSSCGDRSC